MTKKILSYILGLGVGLLAVAPPLDYRIPVLVNSFAWVYLFVAVGLFAMYLAFTGLPLALKTAVFIFFVSSFVSLAPYLSFNAFILIVPAAYLFIAFTKSDYEPIINFVVAAFFIQITFGVLQMFGKDTLMNINRPEPIFLGSVMQNMRFGSLMAIMAPLLVYRNKLFLIPLAIAAVLVESAGFGLALIAGVATYLMMTHSHEWRLWFFIGAMGGLAYLLWDHGSVTTALSCGRIPVWGDIIRTWVMNTLYCDVKPLVGPIDWKSILFGRGMDTFIGLFPLFKHEGNPFWQAHNCHLQLLWEGGVVVYGVLATYIVNLIRRVWSKPLLVAGLVSMAVNMFFAFPTRQTSTMYMMIAFIALCEKEARFCDAWGS
jgi:hypothetical protein